MGIGFRSEGIGLGASEDDLASLEARVAALEVVTQAAQVSVTTTAILSAASQYVFADASGGGFTITLPAVADLIRIDVKKVDTSTNVITIDGNGAETIDGAASIALTGTLNPSVTLIGYSGEWWIVLPIAPS